MQLHQQLQEGLVKALEDQNEQEVGRILTSAFLSVSKSSDSDRSTLIQQIQDVFSNLSNPTQSYWQNIASGYTQS